MEFHDQQQINLCDFSDLLTFFIKGHQHSKIIARNLNLLFLHAEVVGAAGHVGQRADEVVAALKRWIQQHGAHLLHFLQPQKHMRTVFSRGQGHVYCVPQEKLVLDRGKCCNNNYNR